MLFVLYLIFVLLIIGNMEFFSQITERSILNHNIGIRAGCELNLGKETKTQAQRLEDLEVAVIRFKDGQEEFKKQLEEFSEKMERSMNSKMEEIRRLLGGENTMPERSDSVEISAVVSNRMGGSKDDELLIKKAAGDIDTKMEETGRLLRGETTVPERFDSVEIPAVVSKCMGGSKDDKLLIKKAAEDIDTKVFDTMPERENKKLLGVETKKMILNNLYVLEGKELRATDICYKMFDEVLMGEHGKSMLLEFGVELLIEGLKDGNNHIARGTHSFTEFLIDPGGWLFDLLRFVQHSPQVVSLSQVVNNSERSYELWGTARIGDELLKGVLELRYGVGNTLFDSFSEISSLSFVQKDAARRNVLLTSLNYSITSRIDVLKSISAHGGERKLLRQIQHTEFLQRWDLFRGRWRRNLSFFNPFIEPRYLEELTAWISTLSRSILLKPFIWRSCTNLETDEVNMEYKMLILSNNTGSGQMEISCIDVISVCSECELDSSVRYTEQINEVNYVKGRQNFFGNSILPPSGIKLLMNGFATHNCTGFSLQPGESSLLQIAYQSPSTPICVLNSCKRSVFWMWVKKAFAAFLFATLFLGLVVFLLIPHTMATASQAVESMKNSSVTYALNYLCMSFNWRNSGGINLPSGDQELTNSEMDTAPETNMSSFEHLDEQETLDSRNMKLKIEKEKVALNFNVSGLEDLIVARHMSTHLQVNYKRSSPGQHSLTLPVMGYWKYQQMSCLMLYNYFGNAVIVLVLFCFAMNGFAFYISSEQTETLAQAPGLKLVGRDRRVKNVELRSNEDLVALPVRILEDKDLLRGEICHDHANFSRANSTIRLARKGYSWKEE